MFNLKKPCHNCPFRKEGGIRLTPQRAREIAQSQIDGQGASFPCHKTVDYNQDDDADEERPIRKEESYCAGAIAFASNVGSFNQFLRIMGRIGQMNPNNIQDKDQCFSSVREMVAAQKERKPK